MDTSVRSAKPPAKRNRKEKKPSRIPVIRELPQLSKPAALTGYFLRAVISAAAAASLLLLIAAAFFPQYSFTSDVLLCALLDTAAFAVAGLSGKFIFIGLGAFFAEYALRLFLTHISPAVLLRECVVSFFNGIADKLDREGFMSPSRLTSGTPLAVGSEYLVGHTLTLILVPLLCAVFAFSLMKKVRPLPVLLTGSAVCISVFIFNLSMPNSAFAPVIASACAVLALGLYEKYAGSPKKPSVSHLAAGGYTGFAALLLALLTVMIPSAAVREQWKPIRSMDERIASMRQTVTAILTGKSGIDELFGLKRQENSLGTRSTKLTERTYKGEKELQIEAAYNLPVYLRAWVGQTWRFDEWCEITDTELQNYRRYLDSDFDPEEIAALTFSFLPQNPELVRTPNSASLHLKQGFVTTPVHITMSAAAGSLVPIPARRNPSAGILTYDASGFDDLYPNVSPYFDGTFTFSGIASERKYTVLAHLPVYGDPDYPTRMNRILTDTRGIRELLPAYYKSIQYNLDEPPQSFIELSGYTDPEGTIQTALEQFELLSDEEQQRLLTVIDRQVRYTSYVNDSYLTTSGSTPVRELAKELALDFLISHADENGRIVYWDGDVQAYFSADSLRDEPYLFSKLRTVCADYTYLHALACYIADYLQKTCTYTLTPRQPEDSTLNSIEAFLTDTKEGYCVQYATAACLLLREMGIPTRYAEGYMTGGLLRNTDRDSKTSYQATLYDSNRHAWVEIFCPGFGWMTYEMTTALQDEIYTIGRGSSQTPAETTPAPETKAPSETSSPEDTEAPEESEPLLPVTSPDDSRLAAAILYTLLASAAGVLLFLQIRRHEKKGKEITVSQRSLLNAAIRETVPERERLSAAYRLHDILRDIAEIGGLDPQAGEQPRVYAERIDSALRQTPGTPILRHPFTEIMPITERAEFGHSISARELRILAEAVQQLASETKKRLNLPEKFWFCFVRQKLCL